MMSLKNVEGYVEVYEASDGGSGNPVKTSWQFFVNAQPVSIDNKYIAETMRLSIHSSLALTQFDPPSAKKTDPLPGLS